MTTIRHGTLEIEPEAFRAAWNGRPLRLSATELRVLRKLAERRGGVVSAAEIVDAVPERRRQSISASAESIIKRIRRAIRGVDPAAAAIATMRGEGYGLRA